MAEKSRRFGRDKDDRPSRGRRPRRDDDDDPRRTHGRPRARSRTGMWIGLGVGAAVLVIAGVTIFLLSRGGPGSDGAGTDGGDKNLRQGVPATMIKYLPNDTFRVEYSDLVSQRRAFGDQKYRFQIYGIAADTLEEFFGPPENWDSVLAGMRRNGNFTKGQNVVIVRTARPIDQSRIIKNLKPFDASGKKCYELRPNLDAPSAKTLGEYVFFPAEDIMVRADTKQFATELLGGDSGQIAGELKSFLAEATAHQSVVIKEKGGPVAARLETKIWSKERVNLRIVTLFLSEKEAETGRKFYDDQARKPRHPDARMTVTVSGRRVIADATGPADALKHGW